MKITPGHHQLSEVLLLHEGPGAVALLQPGNCSNDSTLRHSGVCVCVCVFKFIIFEDGDDDDDNDDDNYDDV